MLGVPGTGVSRYAATLVKILREADVPLEVLDDQRATTARPRWKRLMAAMKTSPRQVHDGILGPRISDIFREAQVHFDLYGRFLPLKCEGPPGIMHWTYPVPLRMIGWRNIYTVHDAIPLTHPELTPIRQRRHRRTLDCIVRQGARMITVSAAARRDIIDEVGCDPSTVSVCWQGVDLEQGAALPALSHGLTERGYLLFCGTIEPRKNLLRLIEAYRISRLRIPLLLVGPDGWCSSGIVAAVANTPGVVRMPYLERTGLLSLIANARALMFPSLAEGFGLPVAEAMALGTPVLTSNSGALAEIAGEACLKVDPMDVQALADAMTLLTDNDTLCAHLAAAGLQRAALFGKEAYTARLLTLYASIARDR